MRLGTGAGPPRPRRGARRPGGHPRAGARSDPLRAHARLAVHLLPRRGGGDGGRPGGDARRRASSCRPAATRTSRTSAASRRPTAGWCSARTTSTRRSRARGSGTSSGWPRAPRSPAATSACRRSAAQRIVTELRARVPRGDARLREQEPPRRLVRAPQRERARRALRRQAGRQGADRVRARRSRRRGARRACGPSRSSPSASTGACAFAVFRRCWCRSASCSIRPGRAEESAYVRQLLERLRRRPRRRPAPPVPHLPLRRHGAQGRRRGQRRHARLGVPARRPRRQGSARAAGQGGTAVGARAAPGRERVRQPGRARGPGTADVAGGQRHLPQLAAQPTGLDGREHDFYVRQLWDWKASADLSTMCESGLHAYARACGWSLARAHARSGDRLAIAAYLGARAGASTARSHASPPLRRPERARLRTARRCRRGGRGGCAARRLRRPCRR